MHERPDRREYARIERERRFRLDGLPKSVDPNDFVRLRDRFVAGTTVRIRRVERPDGSEVITKIGQKLPLPGAEDDPSRRRLTTIYLEPGQGLAFAALPGISSVKCRHRVEHDGFTWMIDRWEEPTSRAGLVLAEVEADDDAALAAIEPPDWAGKEVTDDPRFAAATLAASGDIAPGTPPSDPVDLDAAFTTITEPWRPVIAGALNGQQIKLARFRGAFDRHHHDHEDEGFLVHRGRFRMEFDDRAVELGPGQMIVVPRGVPHRPVADDTGAEVVLFEPATTRNTGNITNERTAEALPRTSGPSTGQG